MSVITLAQETARPEASNTCNIVVLGENALTRERALELCDRLVTRFDQELAFTLTRWNFTELEYLPSAQSALNALTHADIVVIATHGWDLPPAAVRWLESGVEIRTKLEGVLACVIVEPVNAPDAGEMLLCRLRQIAFGLKMDFLPVVPPPAESKDALNWPVPLIECRDQRGYSHWGLNE